MVVNRKLRTLLVVAALVLGSALYLFYSYQLTRAIRTSYPGAMLLEAADAGQVERVQELLEDGVDPNYLEFGCTPLTAASAKHYDTIVALLIRYGARR